MYDSLVRDYRKIQKTLIGNVFTSIKGTVSGDFLHRFFHESVSPQPQSFPLGPFHIFELEEDDSLKET
jgi:hypothetical protein